MCLQQGCGNPSPRSMTFRYFCLTILHLIDYFKYYFFKITYDVFAGYRVSQSTWESTVRSYLRIELRSNFDGFYENWF